MRAWRVMERGGHMVDHIDGPWTRHFISAAVRKHCKCQAAHA
eukprot:CAMPEP_0119387366 /NCGR_PEP_ID=MMETSP1334-20130426/100363_1 /TAXON_ID=127549 /ORGANISM="Calcidiscus leptoporus, Strain RCC1130" /LENGTH=41 /DNA_ID= /DNA_START= /DNA_END= /DNA_ORIENTATION=